MAPPDASATRAPSKGSAAPPCVRVGVAALKKRWSHVAPSPSKSIEASASVLAAANPLYGRYDDLKHASEQIDFQSSILSRFDAIFIVRDQRLAELDKKIASHVVNLHMNKINVDSHADVSVDMLKKYLTYAKMKIFPRLSEEAGHMLQNMYVTDRANSKDQQISKKTNGIPITVRQLEAIIRLSESIAKMHL